MTENGSSITNVSIYKTLEQETQKLTCAENTTLVNAIEITNVSVTSTLENVKSKSNVCMSKTLGMELQFITCI
jgi:hypothetical protein